MELSLFFVQEKVMQGELLIAHVPSSDQPADRITKAVSKSKFSFLRDKLESRICSRSPRVSPSWN